MSFDILKKKVESEILPQLTALGAGDRDEIRNKIRFSPNESDLQYNLQKLSEQGIKCDLETIKEQIGLENEVQSIANKLSSLPDYLSINKNNNEPKLNIFKLAKFILDKFDIITVEDSDEIYIYNNGVYEVGRKLIAKFVQHKNMGLDGLITTNVINELLGYIRRLTYIKRDKLNEPIDKICLENGILDLKTLDIVEHNPNIIFFNKLPVYYCDKSVCPNIEKFLKQVLNESDIVVIQEIFGYCLLKDYPIHKAIMFNGGGANGKSTLINLIREFLGKENCSSIPLHQLESGRFATANLFGKLANMFADLSDKALKETSFFKMLTGQDLIVAEKKFQDNFFFVNYAKMIFSANQLPKTPEDSDAFFRRWVILNFPNQFLNTKADKRLLEKLTTREELSGLLNFAIEGLRRLQQNGDFSNTKSIDEVRETYIRLSDSVQAFIMDRIEIKPESFIQKKELYTGYADYCRKMNYPITAENKFHGELQKKIRVEDYRPSMDFENKKLRVQCWKGIDFRDLPELNREKNPDNPDYPDNVNDVNDVKAKNPIKCWFSEEEIVKDETQT